MMLETYQLEKYKTTMSERIIEASKQDHIIHGYMVYQCEHCKNIYVMWLEKGLEDPTTYCVVPVIFEPDYWEGKRRSVDYMTEIYINTLPDIEYKVFINDMTNTPDRVAFDDFAGDQIALLNLKDNREQK